MTVDVNKTVLVDGPRIAVVHIVIQGTALGTNDVTNELILDTKNDIYPLGTPTVSTIMRVWWNFNSFEGYLSKQDMAPPVIWSMNAGSSNKIDFRSFGGIKVPVSLDGSGNILLTTKGLTDYAVGTMVIELKKD